MAIKKAINEEKAAKPTEEELEEAAKKKFKMPKIKMPKPRCPKTSRMFLQLSIVLFFITLSCGVLFLVKNMDEQMACDYTDVMDTCEEQPFYRNPMERANALKNFDRNWFVAAQAFRNQSEQDKCRVESNLMKDLTALHHSEADKIITRCHAAFQRCVEEIRKLETTTTTTTSTTTTTTNEDATTTKAPSKQKRCQALADKATTGQLGIYTACITGVKFADDVDESGDKKEERPQADCTICDSYCRTFNWTQSDPEYAKTMYNKSKSGWTCGPKVCPWMSECGDPGGLNLHKNCSAKGCPCVRATCEGRTGTTTSAAAGGRLRRLNKHDKEPPSTSTTITTTTTVFVPYTTTSTYESLENNTNCTCKPGIVDIVLVGRPFKVFFGDPMTMLGDGTGNRRRRRNRQLSNATRGRRLVDLLDEEGRRLEDIYKDYPTMPVEFLQGVFIEMEEEIIEGRDRAFDCRDTFSDRYNYVYPRTKGAKSSFEALIARQSHPDLGCGYKGIFKVTCGPDFYNDTETGNEYTDSGNCSYKVDISTCSPPSYQTAVSECYVEESFGGQSGENIMPTINKFLDIEDLNITTAEPAKNHTIKDVEREQCCTVHVGSECVGGRDHPGTIDGVWDAEKSYNKEFGYFPQMFCSKQAPLTQHTCPRVKIKKLDYSHSFQADATPSCFAACNVTWANQELQSVCDDDVFPSTKLREEQALNNKVSQMKAKRAQLSSWSYSHWPLALKTQHIHDCVVDEKSRRYNMMGWGTGSSVESRQLSYHCRMHSCKSHQCIKVNRPCPIPQMNSATESTCGPFGDQNTYTCVDKVLFSSIGVMSTPFGWAWIAMACIFFTSSCYACIQGCCARKNSRVHPYQVAVPDEEPEIRHCEKCDKMLDMDAVNEGSPICSECIKVGRRPDACVNCMTPFQAPDDKFCTECQAPRVMKAIGDDDDEMCQACGEFMNIMDAKCNECGWHRDSQVAIVVVADPLRANANSAANEQRIVAVDIDPSNNTMPMVQGKE